MGCGNGKYLHLRNVLHSTAQDPVVDPNKSAEAAEASLRSSKISAGAEKLSCMTIGIDRSAELLQFASTQSSRAMAAHKKSKGNQTSAEKWAQANETLPASIRNEVLIGDGLTTCLRSRTFDYTISIATIHHFSTRSRRCEAVRELIRLTQPQRQENDADDSSGRGRFLLYVWALEQRGQERRKFDELDAQPRNLINVSSSAQVSTAKGSRESPPSIRPVEPQQQPAQGRDVLVPWVLKDPAKRTRGKPSEMNLKIDLRQEQPERPTDRVYQRYYHLFEATELESLVEEAVQGLPQSVVESVSAQGESLRLDVKREDSGWERGNWWGIWKCLWREADVQDARAPGGV